MYQYLKQQNEGGTALESAASKMPFLHLLSLNEINRLYTVFELNPATISGDLPSRTEKIPNFDFSPGCDKNCEQAVMHHVLQQSSQLNQIWDTHLPSLTLS